jgi:hypothetical protein
MIKTFRGLIADGVVDTIVLHTNTGSMGYRIVKFEIMPNDPGGNSTEHVMQISKTPNADFVTTPTTVIDFSNQELLAAAIVNNNTNASAYPADSSIIFDQDIFNQDIYLVHKTESTAAACNYYLELEQIKLNLNENSVATLKDIRNITAP